MNHKTALATRSLSLFFLVLVPAAGCYAGLEEFKPYAFTGIIYDSNVYRTPDNENGDTATHLGAGFTSDYKLSRQHFLLNGLLDRLTYDQNSSLDHTNTDGAAIWKWQVGNLWSGNLAYNYSSERVSFDQFLTREKDTKTTHRGEFEAGYQIHPDWRLVAGASVSDVSYEERKRLDRDTTGGTLEVQYRNTRRTRVGLRTRYVDNSFKEKEDVGGTLVDNNYNEADVSAVFYWEGSGKSSLEARLGYTKLDYDELDNRDFSGYTGRLSHQWRISGKTRLDTAIWQETDSKSDEIATYVLTRGVSVTPVWLATRKISARANVTYLNDDYKGSDVNAFLGGGRRREDDIWRYLVSVSYDPIRNLRLSVTYRQENRDSNVNIADFDDQQIGGEVRLTF